MFGNSIVFSRLVRANGDLDVALSNPPTGNSTSLPEMSKWNAFTIDTEMLVCEHGHLTRENVFHSAGIN